MDDEIAWLLTGYPWVQYHTRIDLLNEPPDDPQVGLARQEMVNHPQVQALIRGLQNWGSEPLKSHKSAGHPIHQLTFLADLGLKANDPGMAQVCDVIMAHRSDEGPLQTLLQTAVHFGGDGQNHWAWMLCDAPLLVYCLAKFGLAEEFQVQQAFNYLLGLVQDNGWRCTVSKEMGKFRGPGNKNDPCPYATLLMLKALSVMPASAESEAACRVGAEALLQLWEQRTQRRPYLFAMGADFGKIKAPFIWYDLLHVLEVLSTFEWLHDDVRMIEMADCLRSKADAQGLFTPESVWKAWGEWDFGQKKTPSQWLTLLAQRILYRLG